MTQSAEITVSKTIVDGFTEAWGNYNQIPRKLTYSKQGCVSENSVHLD